MTRPAAEWVAADALRRAGFEVLVLWRAVRVRHARQVSVKRRPLFARYVLGAVDGACAALERMPGVSCIVRAGIKPLIVPEAVIAELRERGDAQGMVGPEQFRPGSEVRILRGPLEGFLAQIASIDGERIRAWVCLFGKPTLSTIAADDLGWIPPPRPRPGSLEPPKPPPPLKPRPAPEWTPEKRELLADTIQRFYSDVPILLRQAVQPTATGICPRCGINCHGYPARPVLPCGVRRCPYERAADHSPLDVGELRRRREPSRPDEGASARWPSR